MTPKMYAICDLNIKNINFSFRCSIQMLYCLAFELILSSTNTALIRGFRCLFKTGANVFHQKLGIFNLTDPITWSPSTSFEVLLEYCVKIVFSVIHSVLIGTNPFGRVTDATYAGIFFGCCIGWSIYNEPRQMGIQ